MNNANGQITPTSPSQIIIKWKWTKKKPETMDNVKVQWVLWEFNGKSMWLRYEWNWILVYWIGIICDFCFPIGNETAASQHCLRIENKTHDILKHRNGNWRCLSFEPALTTISCYLWSKEYLQRYYVVRDRERVRGRGHAGLPFPQMTNNEQQWNSVLFL